MQVISMNIKICQGFSQIKLCFHMSRDKYRKYRRRGVRTQKINGDLFTGRRFYTICNIMRTLEQNMYKQRAERI